MKNSLPKSKQQRINVEVMSSKCRVSINILKHRLLFLLKSFGLWLLLLFIIAVCILFQVNTCRPTASARGPGRSTIDQGEYNGGEMEVSNFFFLIVINIVVFEKNE